MTRAHVRLLGPCFKTGRVDCRQNRHRPYTHARPTRSDREGAVGGHGAEPLSHASRTPPEGRAATKRAVVPHPQRGTTAGELYQQTPRRPPTCPPRPTSPPEGDRSARTDGKCTRKFPENSCGTGPEGSRPPSPEGYTSAEFRRSKMRIHPFTSERFHVLLNSLFKVLFNFPSRYLFAIGLTPVFSLRWSLPPTLGCIPKQPDS